MGYEWRKIISFLASTKKQILSGFCGDRQLKRCGVITISIYVVRFEKPKLYALSKFSGILDYC